MLERWARRPKSAQALAFRCRIVLAAAEGRSSTEIAAELGCTGSTVGKWRGRFARRGLDGLHDEPRPGKPRTISDEDVERVIVKTLEEQPANATHWSTRSMAAATGMSQSAVSRIWRAFGLKPHQVETFKLSPDPLFIDKVRDIVGLYLNPPEAAVVLCVDEKSQIQALDRTAPVLPLMPGVPSAQSHDYVRNGTTNLYAALDVASGQRDRRDDAAASRRGVPPLPQPDRRLRAGAPRRARRPRQLLDPQDAIDPALAAPPPALHAALHADLQLLAEPRRALVRRADDEVDQTRTPTAPSATSSPRSAPGSPTGTTTPSPSSGTRPPTRSSTASPPTASESTTQVTSPPRARIKPTRSCSVRPGRVTEGAGWRPSLPPRRSRPGHCLARAGVASLHVSRCRRTARTAPSP